MKSTGDKERISLPENTPGLFADAANARVNASEKVKKTEESKRNARCRVSKGTQKRIAVLICSLILVLGVAIGVFFAVTMRKSDPVSATLNTACELVKENELYPIFDAFLTDGGEISLSANGYREDKSAIPLSSRAWTHPIFPEFSFDASYAEDGEGAGQIRLETSMIYDEDVDAEIFENKSCSVAAVFDEDKVYFATSEANDGKYFGFTTENFREKLASSEYSHTAGNNFSFSETLEERICSFFEKMYDGTQRAKLTACYENAAKELPGVIRDALQSYGSDETKMISDPFTNRKYEANVYVYSLNSAEYVAFLESIRLWICQSSGYFDAEALSTEIEYEQSDIEAHESTLELRFCVRRGMLTELEIKETRNYYVEERRESTNEDTFRLYFGKSPSWSVGFLAEYVSVYTAYSPTAPDTVYAKNIRSESLSVICENDDASEASFVIDHTVVPSSQANPESRVIGIYRNKKTDSFSISYSDNDGSSVVARGKMYVAKDSLDLTLDSFEMPHEARYDNVKIEFSLVTGKKEIEMPTEVTDILASESYDTCQAVLRGFEKAADTVSIFIDKFFRNAFEQWLSVPNANDNSLV